MRTLFLGFGALLSMAAYGAPSAERIDPKVVDANTTFGFAMLKQLFGEGGGKANVVISPASLSLALSMTYNGSSGATRDAMAKTLGYIGLSLDRVNAGNKALLVSLAKPGEGIELSVANSLWARDDVAFKPDFLQRNREFFGAQINTLTTADKINAWVSKNTHGKIDRIVSRIDPSHILFLVNAVYFNGLWSAPFDAKLTRDGEFTTAAGAAVKVPMMHNTARYEYLDGDGFQLINLAYGKGRVSMYVLLPAKGTNLKSFLSKVTPAAWNAWIKQIQGRTSEVELVLPRFKLEYKAEAEAKRALTALGMGVAFDPDKADFKAMCTIPPTPNVYIGEVVHKTYIDVNEKGTEAAAATSVGMRATAVGPGMTPRMIVDHPFLLAIRDNETGEMLFVGAIVQPATCN